MLIYPPKPLTICLINDLSSRKHVTWWGSSVFGFCFKTMVKTLDVCFHPVKAKVKNKTDVPYYSCSCIIYCKNTEVCFSTMVWNDTWCSECEQAASLDPITACNPHFYWRAKKKSIQQYDVGSMRVLLVPFYIRKRPHLSVCLTAKWLHHWQTNFHEAVDVHGSLRVFLMVLVNPMTHFFVFCFKSKL